MARQAPHSLENNKIMTFSLFHVSVIFIAIWPSLRLIFQILYRQTSFCFAITIIDGFALGLGPSGAILLHDGGALLLVHGDALLVKLGGAFLLMDGLVDSSGQVNALHLGDRVTFLLKLLLTSPLNVI